MKKKKKEVKNFLIKFFIFFSPIIIFTCFKFIADVILPIDYFTFRAWEALTVYEKTNILSGEFYPNMHLVKTEFGDLSGISKYPVAKNVEWFTDKYGYRIKNYKNRDYETVIIGDSSVAGSALTQDDTIAEKIYKKTGIYTYPYAPSNFNNFLKEDRFKKNPPKIIVVAYVEKLVLGIPEILPKEELYFKKLTWYSVRPFSSFAIMEDRLKKNVLINYLLARIDNMSKNSGKSGRKFKRPGAIDFENLGKGERSEMVFYSEPKEYFRQWSESEIKRVIFTLNQYKDELAKTNTKLIFMPIPNKENIYWCQVNGGKRTNNLKILIDEAEKTGITTVDLWSVYNNLYTENPDRLLYHTDDTHWNGFGVEIAVDLLIKKINEVY